MTRGTRETREMTRGTREMTRETREMTRGTTRSRVAKLLKTFKSGNVCFSSGIRPFFYVYKTSMARFYLEI